MRKCCAAETLSGLLSNPVTASDKAPSPLQPLFCHNHPSISSVFWLPQMTVFMGTDLQLPKLMHQVGNEFW